MQRQTTLWTHAKNHAAISSATNVKMFRHDDPWHAWHLAFPYQLNIPSLFNDTQCDSTWFNSAHLSCFQGVGVLSLAARLTYICPNEPLPQTAFACISHSKSFEHIFLGGIDYQMKTASLWHIFVLTASYSSSPLVEFLKQSGLSLNVSQGWQPPRPQTVKSQHVRSENAVPTSHDLSASLVVHGTCSCAVAICEPLFYTEVFFRQDYGHGMVLGDAVCWCLLESWNVWVQKYYKSI